MHWDSPEQQTSTYQYYSDNLLKSFTDSLNRTTTLTYDADSHQTSVTRLAGASNAVTSSSAYGGPFGADIECHRSAWSTPALLVMMRAEI